MKVSAATQPFAVLGHPVRHSLSPRMHNAAFEALRMDAVYLALDVVPEDVATVLPLLGRAGFGGVNITLPLKEETFRAVNILDDSAQQMGAVNTVVFRHGETTGFNTDGMGFIRAVKEELDFSFCGKHVLILGAGGAARAAAMSAAGEGADRITVANRTLERAAALIQSVKQWFSDVHVDVLNLDGAADMAQKADLIVQSTSAGLNAEEPPILKAGAFRAGQCVYDMIYTQSRTPILREAESVGGRVANGLGMLLYQGAAAFERWTGQQPPVDVMRRVLTETVEC